MLGFCRSVSDLSEVVEDAVLSCGGKIVLNQIEMKRCRHFTTLHCLSGSRHRQECGQSDTWQRHSWDVHASQRHMLLLYLSIKGCRGDRGT